MESPESLPQSCHGHPSSDLRGCLSRQTYRACPQCPKMTWTDIVCSRMSAACSNTDSATTSPCPWSLAHSPSVTWPCALARTVRRAAWCGPTPPRSCWEAPFPPVDVHILATSPAALTVDPDEAVPLRDAFQHHTGLGLFFSVVGSHAASLTSSFVHCPQSRPFGVALLIAGKDPDQGPVL